VLTDPDGKVIAQGSATRAGSPAGWRAVRNRTPDGELQLHMAPAPTVVTARARRRPHGGRPPPGGRGFWLGPPFGFLWMLGLVGVAVVVGVFPIIRRLLKRLENLQRGVSALARAICRCASPSMGMTRWPIWRTSSTPLPSASKP
jgi:hypothetical protein